MTAGTRVIAILFRPIIFPTRDRFGEAEGSSKARASTLSVACSEAYTQSVEVSNINDLSVQKRGLLLSMRNSANVGFLALKPASHSPL